MARTEACAEGGSGRAKRRRTNDPAHDGMNDGQGQTDTTMYRKRVVPVPGDSPVSRERWRWRWRWRCAGARECGGAR